MSDGLDNVGGSAPTEISAATEKMIPQSEVNKIVGEKKLETEQKAYERARREILEQIRAEKSNEAPQAASHGHSIDDIKRIALEATKSHHEEQMKRVVVEKTVSEVVAKLSRGKEKYGEDYVTAVSKLKLQENTGILIALNQFDNAEDIAMHIGSNAGLRAKIKAESRVDIDDLTDTLKEISDALKANEFATKNAKPTKEPLKQMKSTYSGSVDSGSLSVSELRKLYLKRK